MITKKGLEVYPLRLRRILLGRTIIYDRDKRGKSWFLLDLDLSGESAFIPKDSTGLLTADGLRFCEHFESRR